MAIWKDTRRSGVDVGEIGDVTDQAEFVDMRKYQVLHDFLLVHLVWVGD